MVEKRFYIASQYAPCGNCVSWWAFDGKGYTCNLSEAWQVTEKQAKSICSDPSRNETYWPVEEVDKRAFRHFDIQLLKEIKPHA